MDAMPSLNRRVRPAAAVAAALCLTFGAGFVDAFGYLKLSHVYTANLSGNTVLIGIRSAGGQPSTALLHAFTIAMFLIGLLVSGVLIELALRHRVRRVLGATMGLETILLTGLAVFSGTLADLGSATAGWHLYALLALAAIAMGAQNTSLRMAGILSVYTTHVTGAVTRFSEHALAWLFAVADRRRSRGDESSHRGPAREFGQAMLAGGVWVAFLGGACLASYLAPRWGARALAWPLGIVILVGLIDCACPLARLPRDSGGQAR
jgi:uncharacterized membrane protein YoaK (UPF0700 family)